MSIAESLSGTRKVYALRESKIALAFGGTLTAAILSALVVWTYVSRNAALDEWQLIAKSISSSTADQVSQSLRAAELVLKSIDDTVNQTELRNAGDVRSAFGNYATFESIRERALVVPQVDVATITDNTGKVINFTRSFPPPPINLSDRDYFRAFASQPDLKNFLSVPVRNRGTGTWTFYIVRPIRSVANEFLGTLLTGLHVDFFCQMFSKFAISPAVSISLLRQDGVLIARHPVQEELLGQSFANMPVFRELVAAGRFGESTVTDVPRLSSGLRELRIMSPAKVENYPLFVNVTIGHDLIFANWYVTAMWVGSTTLPLVLIVLFLTHRTAILLYAQHTALQRLSDERQRADKASMELFRLSRLSTMQEMSSAIAHELNQPLSATANYLSVALIHLGAAASHDHLRRSQVLERAQEQVLRAGDIIRRLRDFISRGKSDQVQVEVVKIVSAAVGFSLIQDQHPEIKLVLHHDAPHSLVRVDSLQVQQVLINLIRNATEALSSQTDKKLTIRTDMIADSFVEFTVTDNGPGMAPEVRERVFQPFNSGKDKGMGVGLSICRTIVEAHGGTISCAAVATGGVEFRFTLPLAKD